MVRIMIRFRVIFMVMVMVRFTITSGSHKRFFWVNDQSPNVP